MEAIQQWKLYSGLPMCAGVPLLFMTNLGADPSQELQEVANSIVGAAAYHQLAMGQGQTQPALDLLQSCALSGAAPRTCLLASAQLGTMHVVKAYCERHVDCLPERKPMCERIQISGIGVAILILRLGLV